ncbi:hypothetical protein Pmgp_00614 [Pelotomaculum propionicicum]|uniref:Thioredoxin-like fold domain-containing protein n=1 Tax=Pelotomaculum propionicicum TaxID=258475 RepID=A0A4Y7RW79_9FIRM|nr:hypothetical protein Pmgp_00614 [Pelotomaculum propionicicum]
MVESVKALPKEIQAMIELQVWNIERIDVINRKMSLRAKSIPSIAINQEMIFESTIPPQEDLISAIQKKYSP